VIRKIITISSDSTVQEAIETMNDRSTSCLVILLEGRVIGIITVQDLVYRVVAKGLNPQKTRVQEISSRPVVVMRPETALVTAVKVMLQKKIKKIPLINGEKGYGRLIGLVSFSDIIKYHSLLLANLLEELLLTVPALSLEEDIVVVES